ncbi:MAG: ABC transporter ATP-binding protein, partial [Verrucomicrobia bacterium]|nr:ABC transporter ATP-binding protein [Verrucomicrobiota bacterium]
RSQQLLEMVGLSQANTRAVGEFSKGMQRRIGLAQALINDPDLIILDEPTAGLDPLGCREVKDVILALARRGKTIILTSHLLSDVEDVCDRVVIYYGGRIQAMGTLNELLSKPDTLRITCPVLSRATTERVLQIIREEAGADRVRLDNPTQNLESYFLDVVEKARRRFDTTSGATSGNKMAEYLSADAGAAPAETHKTLERLLAAAPESVPVSPAATPVSGNVDLGKLSALTAQPTPPPPASSSEASSTPALSPEETAQANAKLSSLLRKPEA